MNKLKLKYNTRIGLFGSIEPTELQTYLDKYTQEQGWRDVEYITGTLGYIANVMTDYHFEPEREYNRCIIFWDGSEECHKVLQHCKKENIPCYVVNKPDNSFTKELITVANAHWFKPEPDDIVVYIGRGRLPEQAHINGNCGNPFTVQEYGRGIALAKYIQSKPDLTNLIELVRPYFGKRQIVLLCWCKPNKCHGDYIKQQLMKELL